MFDWPPLTLHAVAVAPDPNSNHARTKHLEQHFGVGIVPAQISDNQSIGIVAAINRRERARTRTSIESLRQLSSSLIPSSRGSNGPFPPITAVERS
jgi:hypothetical protein